MDIVESDPLAHAPDAPAARHAAAEGSPATAPAWALTLRALVAFLALDLGFRLLGFGRVYRYVLGRRPRPARWPPAEGGRRARGTFRAVQNATALYYRSREDCLPKALATFHLLRRQGIPAELCFAVTKFPFSGHAWVESYGEILDDDPERPSLYTAIHRVPS